MRVVSLLPAATEWLCSFGAGGALVGRSHACDAPPAVEALPVLTRPLVAGDDAAALDEALRDGLRRGLPLLKIDRRRLQALRPDLVLAQEGAWPDESGAAPAVFSMAPTTFKEVLGAALRLGRVLGREAEAMRFIGAAEKRLQLLRIRLDLRRKQEPGAGPRIACIAWPAPLMMAGLWVPDAVALAGGRAMLAEPGAFSTGAAWAALRAADPEVIVVAPCGFTLEQTRKNLHHLTEHPGWHGLRAVRAGRVYCMDGRAYVHRPGPRLYRTVELFAFALHPGRLSADEMGIATWEMVRFGHAEA